MNTQSFPNTRQAWLALLDWLDEPDSVYTDQDDRECKEIINRSISIAEPDDALDLVREFQRQPHWVYPTPEELRNSVLSTGAGYDYSYGARLFKSQDQIDGFIIPLLRAQPHSRRGIAMLYEPQSDSKVNASHVPVFVSLHFRLFDKLEMTCHVRSSDLFIGFPANIYQLRTIQRYVADKLGVAAGTIHCMLGSIHFFTEYQPFLPSMAKVIKKER